MTPLQVGPEKAVRIVEIGEDQIEAPDVIHPGRVRSTARGVKKGAERPVVHRADAVEIMAVERDLGEVGMAKHVDVGPGPFFAQEPQRRQRDDEIAQPASADEKDSHGAAILPIDKPGPLGHSALMRVFEVHLRSGAKVEVTAEVLQDNPGNDDKIYFYRRPEPQASRRLLPARLRGRDLLRPGHSSTLQHRYTR